MAIIRPSLKFAGSELNLGSSSSPYIKESVRRAVFNKTTNQEGAYLYFLPAYKADHEGNGVWFKKIYVRDNFGVSYKEKYVILDRAQDPAEYFANNFRILYPEDAKVTDVEANGKKFKKYPFCGRIAERVVYNVAFAQNLAAGAHVLDLPLRNGADTLMNWLEGKDLRGNPRQPVNDPDRCVPVFVKLKENTQNPWTIQIESSQPVALPEQLADSDYLYDLDNIFVTKTNDEIIGKLREMYSADVFEDCMQGFAGLTKNSVQGAGVSQAQVAPQTLQSVNQMAQLAQAAPALPQLPQQNTQQTQEIAKPAVAPVVNIPRATISAPIAPVNPPPTADIGELPPNPMAGGRLSREEAMRFMAQD
jgi:hypothetical protein